MRSIWLYCNKAVVFPASTAWRRISLLAIFISMSTANSGNIRTRGTYGRVFRNELYERTAGYFGMNRISDLLGFETPALAETQGYPASLSAIKVASLLMKGFGNGNHGFSLDLNMINLQDCFGGESLRKH